MSTKDALIALKRFRDELLRMHPENVTPQNWLALQRVLLTFLDSHRAVLKHNSRLSRTMKRITRNLRNVRSHPQGDCRDRIQGHEE